jgi:hypothetical protein
MVRGVKAAHWLFAYLAAVVVVTLLHEPWLLAVLLAGALGRQRRRALAHPARAVLAGLTFNLAVSLGYCGGGACGQANFSGPLPVCWVNLRVLLLLHLGFWFVRPA